MCDWLTKPSPEDCNVPRCPTRYISFSLILFSNYWYIGKYDSVSRRAFPGEVRHLFHLTSFTHSPALPSTRLTLEVDTKKWDLLLKLAPQPLRIPSFQPLSRKSPYLGHSSPAIERKNCQSLRERNFVMFWTKNTQIITYKLASYVMPISNLSLIFFLVYMTFWQVPRKIKKNTRLSHDQTLSFVVMILR